MVLEAVLAASFSRSDLPKVRTPLQAILESCARQEAGDEEGALQVLIAANDAADRTPSTSIPPEH
jgi:hypothetical protein